MESKKRIYFENLDGLRFLCFLSVFLYHSFHTSFDYIKENDIYYMIKKEWFGNGNLGVNFFFVLSGFLITYLLIEEKKLNGQINLKRFWIRRVLRIWPLFYLCVAFGFLIFPLLKQAFGQVPNENASLVFYLTFLNNFDLIAKGSPDSSVLSVLWSVAIEEQFYLVWPIVIFLVPIEKLWIPFLLIITGSLLFRAYNDTTIMHEFHTLSCIGDMAIGALGAWLIVISQRFKSSIESLSKFQIALLYTVCLLIFFYRDEVFFFNHTIRIFERTFIAMFMILVILEQTFSHHSFVKMSSFKRISQLGIITYGLYCLHFIGILIATTLTKKAGLNVELWQVLFLDTILALIFSIIIAKISYRYIEQPFLRIKEKFSYFQK